MSIFDDVLESIRKNGMTQGAIIEGVDGPRCLNGHLAGCHGLLGITDYHYVDEVGAVEVGWLAGASEAEKAAAEQYDTACQFLARVIVEQYEDVLHAELERYNNARCQGQQYLRKTHWWELFGSCSAEEAIIHCSHDIIATFNDIVTADDVIRVVEKARSQV